MLSVGMKITLVCGTEVGGPAELNHNEGGCGHDMQPEHNS